MADLPLSILLISNSTSRRKLIESGLKHAVVTGALSSELDYLSKTLSQLNPDVIIMDCENPKQSIIQNLKMATQAAPLPIIMFVEGSDGALAREAIRSGISAYIVDGLTPPRVQPVVDIAIERFKMIDTLKKELEKSQESLEARKLIERAKGILMDKRGMSEAQAFKSMRELAMKESITIKQVSENILSVFDLLQGEA